MSYKQKIYNNVEDFLVKNIDLHIDQTSINGIHFTAREIDVVACLLGGRSTKKIAAFLLISSKTVENHIHNIMLKLRCSSRENIIDFLEKSENFSRLKKHYANILIKIAFETALKKASTVATKKLSCHVDLYHTYKQKEKHILVFHLKKHLSIVGIKVYSKFWDLQKRMVPYFPSTEQPIENAIYIMSSEFLKQLNNPDQSVNWEKIKLHNKNLHSNEMLLLLEELKEPDLIRAQDHLFTYIDTTKQADYYFVVFELLQTLLPANSIEKNLEEFKRQYKILIDQPDSELQSIEVQEQLILNLPLRNNRFTGRENNLTSIQEQLNTQKFGTITQVITGLGGVGKTQLAIEFAYQAIEKKYYKVILLVTAETSNSIHDAYKKFAESLQINVENLNINSIQKVIHHYLITKYASSTILLILDNVKSYECIKCYLNLLYDQLAVQITLHVLITSRSQTWSEPTLVLDLFSQQEASIFIRKHLENEAEGAIVRLSQTLNCFPLALSQAIAYIKAHTNIDDYLEAYVINPQIYLDLFSNNNDRYVGSLWKTWNLTLTKLSQNGQKFLFIAAYLNPDHIPIDMFDYLTVIERMEIIQDLRQHSLITLINNNKAFKIHRLLQEIIRLTKKPRVTWLKEYDGLAEAINLIEKKFDFNYLELTKWELWGKYLTHAKTIAEHVLNIQNKLLYRGIKLYAKVAMFMTHILVDDTEETAQFWLNLLQLIEKYYINKQSNQLLIAMINAYLGNQKRFVNQVDEATAYFNKAILLYSQINPNINIVTNQCWELMDLLRVIPLNNNVKFDDQINYDLGFTLILLGNTFNYALVDADLAIQPYTRAIELFSNLEKIDLIKDPIKYQKADVLSSLGGSHIYLGNLLLAEHLLNTAKKLALPIYTDHQQLSFIYYKLGLIYYYRGKFQEAEDLLQEALDILSNNFPKEHFYINVIKMYMGLNAYMLGNNEVAKSLLEEVIIYLDPNKKYWYWFSKLNLVRVYENIRLYDKALDLLNETVILAKVHYKEKLHKAMAFQLSRAEIWTKLHIPKNFNIIAFFAHMTESIIQLFGKEHYQTARYYHLYGQALANIHQYQEAMLQYQKALAILNKEEINHPDLISFQQQNSQFLQKLMQELALTIN